ncbi:helix-turn-helix domain-containing protein [Cellulomonas sp. SLBN-39]|uniref:helix-turn-helix domain-containing protein n=1 Tax=Cellulomonas sp. SLBN-39 TaxID=2768446 RepID=UPI00135CB484
MSAPAPERRHPHVLTLDDVATLTGKPPATVARWATAGTIPGVRFGRAWRFWPPRSPWPCTAPTALALSRRCPRGMSSPGCSRPAA